MKPRTRRIINFALIIGTLAIVLIIGITDQDIGSAMDALRGLGLQWALLCLACYMAFVTMDAASIHYFLRNQGCRLSFGYVFYVSIVGQYYSNITPGASGGQPMQIYYLHERGIPTGVATSALVVRFISFQAMLSVIGTVMWIAYGPFIAEHLGGNIWILIVGYTYNTLMITLLIVIVLRRSVINWLVNLVVKIGSRLRLIKQPESTQQRWLHAASTFHDSLQLIIHKPGQLAVQFLLGGAQLVFLMSVIWFVYCGLGLSGMTWGQLTSLSVMEYLSAAYAPLPGASGATEGVFSLYFNSVFPGGNLLAALLLWRFFTYYFSLILGAVTVTVGGIRSGKTLREVARMGDESVDRSGRMM